MSEGLGDRRTKEVVGFRCGKRSLRDLFDGWIGLGRGIDFDIYWTKTLLYQLFFLILFTRDDSLLTVEGANFSNRESIVMIGASSLLSEEGVYLISIGFFDVIAGAVILIGVLSLQLALASALPRAVA